MCSTLSANTGLYTLNCSSTYVTYPKLSFVSSALYAKPIPNLKTWHYCLGHCSNQTIVCMACNQITKGMPINLSVAPLTYDSYILGKQTHSSVPKIKEGLWAISPLEHIYIDLCGPQPVASCTGNKFSMNVIDDFSGYVWSLPLKLKSDAIHVLWG